MLNQSRTDFHNVPNEIILLIFSYVDPVSLLILCCVNKQFNWIGSDERLWKRFVGSEPSSLLQSPLNVQKLLADIITIEAGLKNRDKNAKKMYSPIIFSYVHALTDLSSLENIGDLNRSQFKKLDVRVLQAIYRLVSNLPSNPEKLSKEEEAHDHLYHHIIRPLANVQGAKAIFFVKPAVFDKINDFYLKEKNKYKLPVLTEILFKILMTSRNAYVINKTIELVENGGIRTVRSEDIWCAFLAFQEEYTVKMGIMPRIFSFFGRNKVKENPVSYKKEFINHSWLRQPVRYHHSEQFKCYQLVQSIRQHEERLKKDEWCRAHIDRLPSLLLSYAYYLSGKNLSKKNMNELDLWALSKEADSRILTALDSLFSVTNAYYCTKELEYHPHARLYHLFKEIIQENGKKAVLFADPNFLGCLSHFFINGPIAKFQIAVTFLSKGREIWVKPSKTNVLERVLNYVEMTNVKEIDLNKMLEMLKEEHREKKVMKLSF